MSDSFDTHMQSLRVIWTAYQIGAVKYSHVTRAHELQEKGLPIDGLTLDYQQEYVLEHFEEVDPIGGSSAIFDYANSHTLTDHTFRIYFDSIMGEALMFDMNAEHKLLAIFFDSVNAIEEVKPSDHNYKMLTDVFAWYVESGTLAYMLELQTEAAAI